MLQESLYSCSASRRFMRNPVQNIWPLPERHIYQQQEALVICKSNESPRGDSPPVGQRRPPVRRVECFTQRLVRETAEAAEQWRRTGDVAPAGRGSRCRQCWSRRPEHHSVEQANGSDAHATQRSRPTKSSVNLHYEYVLEGTRPDGGPRDTGKTPR